MKRILALMLTFTMTLAFMPMIAFADDCPHNHKTEEYVWDDDADVVPVDNASHSVTGTGVMEIWCEDCGKRTGLEPYVFDGDEFPHDYDENGYCETCGHQNTCSHGTHYEVYSFNDDAVYTPVDDEYHSVTGSGEIETWCKYCGMQIKTETRSFDGDEFPHDYDESGYCESCGHHNACSHETTHPEYTWDDDADITPVDDEYHSVTGTGTKETVCDECGMPINAEPYEADGEEFEHDLDEIGYCDVCGYQSALDERIYGSSRYDTALAIADKMKEETGALFDNIIVANGDNYPDALSGGYLASVMQAPILLVSPSVESKIADYINKNIADEGTVYLLGGTGAVSSSFENILEQKGIYTKRLGGKDRYETNIKILEAAGVDDEDLLVCTGTDYADSLSASATEMPILLVGGTLTDAQKTYIKSLNTEEFYLIGGEGAVKPKIKADLIKLGYSEDSIDRIAGGTRYETSTAVAEAFFNEPTTVVLAYALNFPDGLSGGPLAMLYGAPIILTDSNYIKASQKYIKESGAKWSITLGGKSLISDAAVKANMGR